MPGLPNFFLVGAPKAGTTSLYHYLDQHPQIYLCPLKEPQYFAEEIREPNFDPVQRRRLARANLQLRDFLAGPMTGKINGGTITHWEDYVRLFAHASNQPAIGEASPSYLWSPTAAAAIAAKIPRAKILVLLRDPAARAFSQYNQMLGNGVVDCSFREHIERSLRRPSSEMCASHLFLEFGLYSAQLCRYFQKFGRDVWVGLDIDYGRDPAQMYRDVCRFLGVSDDFLPDMDERHMAAQVPRFRAVGALKRNGVWKAAASLTPEPVRPLLRRALIRPPGAIRMDPADRRYLIDFYREDIRKLETLLNRDLESWLRP